MGQASYTLGFELEKMIKHKIALGLCCSLVLAFSGCSRQQSDWQKTRETNTADAYQQFLKKYPSGEFTAQAQARVKELYEERDWQKARDADTPEAYQAFLKQYPEGKWTEEARIRVENFTLAQAPSGSAAPPPAGSEPSATAASPAPGADAVEKAAPAPAAPPKIVKQPAPSATSPPAPSATATQPRKATPEIPVKASSGPYRVQLGAFKSGAEAAKARWARLQQDYPTLLAGLSSKVVPKKTANGNLYRLQAIGLTEKHARDVCTALKAKSQPCIVVAPANG
jgi:cell division protein FtsN